MDDKSSLKRYSQCMESRGVKSHLYDNSRGSSLLATARAGLLLTRERWARIDQEVDPICRNCGMVAETMEHVLFECNDVYFSEEDVRPALGFGQTDVISNASRTKKLLENWERSTVEIRRTSKEARP